MGTFVLNSRILPPPRLRVDFPSGRYFIDSPVFVTDGPSRHSRRVVDVSCGSEVELLETATLVEEERIRGRISNPPGWISLQDLCHNWFFGDGPWVRGPFCAKYSPGKHTIL